MGNTIYYLKTQKCKEFIELCMLDILDLGYSGYIGIFRFSLFDFFVLGNLFDLLDGGALVPWCLVTQASLPWCVRALVLRGYLGT